MKHVKRERRSARISDLCAQLPDRLIDPIEVSGTPGVRPDPARVRALALEKIRRPAAGAPQQVERGETMREYRIHRRAVRLAAVAAAVCLFSATAFAVAGGLDHFRSIFGPSAQRVSGAIETPAVSDENEDYRMTVGSVLSDGFNTYLVVSLRSLRGGALPEADGRVPLFTPDETGGLSSVTCSDLEDFTMPDERYYQVRLSSLENGGERTVRLKLDEAVAPLAVEFTAGPGAAAREIAVGQTLGSGWRIDTVQLSPLGALVTGVEAERKGGLPTAPILLRMKDGSAETLFDESSFDGGGETVMGGGSAVIGGAGDLPLVTGTQGARRPDGGVATAATFSRVLDLDEAAALVVDGTEYPLG